MDDLKGFVSDYTKGLSTVATANTLMYLKTIIEGAINFKVPVKPLYLKQDTDNIEYREPTNKELLTFLKVALEEWVNVLDKDLKEIETN